MLQNSSTFKANLKKKNMLIHHQLGRYVSKLGPKSERKEAVHRKVGGVSVGTTLNLETRPINSVPRCCQISCPYLSYLCHQICHHEELQTCPKLNILRGRATRFLLSDARSQGLIVSLVKWKIVFTFSLFISNLSVCRERHRKDLQPISMLH